MAPELPEVFSATIAFSLRTDAANAYAALAATPLLSTLNRHLLLPL